MYKVYVVTYTVVAWYGDVNVSQWRAGVTEANHRDVDIGGFRDWLQAREKNNHHVRHKLKTSSLDKIHVKTKITKIRNFLKQTPRRLIFHAADTSSDYLIEGCNKN